MAAVRNHACTCIYLGRLGGKLLGIHENEPASLGINGMLIISSAFRRQRDHSDNRRDIRDSYMLHN